MVATDDTVRGHIGNALQILGAACPIIGPHGNDRLSYSLTPDEHDALRDRLRAALTLLDQQESNR